MYDYASGHTLAEGIEFLEGSYGDYGPVRVVLDTLEQARFDLNTFKLANEGHVRMIADLAAERDNLESQLAALRLTLADACTQRDKYMRRTAEWRDAALNGTAFTVACTGCNDECSACREEG